MNWSNIQFFLVCVVIIGLIVFWDRSKKILDSRAILTVERMPNTLLDTMLGINETT